MRKPEFGQRFSQTSDNVRQRHICRNRHGLRTLPVDPASNPSDTFERHRIIEPGQPAAKIGTFQQNVHRTFEVFRLHIKIADTPAYVQFRGQHFGRARTKRKPQPFQTFLQTDIDPGKLKFGRGTQFIQPQNRCIPDSDSALLVQPLQPSSPIRFIGRLRKAQTGNLYAPFRIPAYDQLW